MLGACVRAGSVTVAAKKLAIYELYLVGVQENIWDKRGHDMGRGLKFFLRKGNENHQLGT